MTRVSKPMILRVLAAHDWRFARTTAELATSRAHPRPRGWRVGLDVPADCVKARSIAGLIDDEWCGYGRVISTDAPPPWRLTYTRFVPLEEMPEHVRKAVEAWADWEEVIGKGATLQLDAYEASEEAWHAFKAAFEAAKASDAAEGG